MGDILNTLTISELEDIRLQIAMKRGREERACAWCDKPVSMIKNQRFCGPTCRVRYSQAAAIIEHERLVMQQAVWVEERAKLVQEIADLRRRLLEADLLP